MAPNRHFQIFIPLGIILFLLVVIIGPTTMSMVMNDGISTPCPLMGGMNMCPMSPLQHSDVLQHMLTAIPATGVTLLLTLVALVFSLPFFRRMLTFRDLEKLSHHNSRYRQRFSFVYLTPLQQAFSDGILHPKLY